MPGGTHPVGLLTAAQVIQALHANSGLAIRIGVGLFGALLVLGLLAQAGLVHDSFTLCYFICVEHFVQLMIDKFDACEKHRDNCCIDEPCKKI